MAITASPIGELIKNLYTSNQENTHLLGKIAQNTENLLQKLDTSKGSNFFTNLVANLVGGGLLASAVKNKIKNKRITPIMLEEEKPIKLKLAPSARGTTKNWGPTFPDLKKQKYAGQTVFNPPAVNPKKPIYPKEEESPVAMSPDPTKEFDKEESPIKKLLVEKIRKATAARNKREAINKKRRDKYAEKKKTKEEETEKWREEKDKLKKKNKKGEKAGLSAEEDASAPKKPDSFINKIKKTGKKLWQDDEGWIDLNRAKKGVTSSFNKLEKGVETFTKGVEKSPWKSAAYAFGAATATAKLGMAIGAGGESTVTSNQGSWNKIVSSGTAGDILPWGIYTLGFNTFTMGQQLGSMLSGLFKGVG